MSTSLPILGLPEVISPISFIEFSITATQK